MDKEKTVCCSYLEKVSRKNTEKEIDVRMFVSYDAFLYIKEAWEKDGLLPPELLKNKKACSYYISFRKIKKDFTETELYKCINQIANEMPNIAIIAQIFANGEHLNVIANSKGYELVVEYDHANSRIVNILDEWHIRKCEQLVKEYGENKKISSLPENLLSYIHEVLSDIADEISFSMENNGTTWEEVLQEIQQVIRMGTLKDINKLVTHYLDYKE